MSDEASGSAEPADAGGRRFAAQILPHLDAAYRFAVSLTRSRADAEDVVQDAMLRAYRAIETLRGTDARAWLFAIVRNAYLTTRTRSANRASVPLPAEGSEPFEALIEGAPGPESAALRASESQAIGQSLARLSSEHREVLVLREIEELSYQDIARITELPIGTVMSRLARARAAFREQWLEDHGSA